MDYVIDLKQNKGYFTIGLIVSLTIFLSSASSLNVVPAAAQGWLVSGEDCVYMEDDNSEICCDDTPDPNNSGETVVTCTKCDTLNLETGEKSDCYPVENEIDTNATSVPRTDQGVVNPGAG